MHPLKASRHLALAALAVLAPALAAAVEVRFVPVADGVFAHVGDTGARSTFLLISVDGPEIRFQTYRDDAQGGPYSLNQQGNLRPLFQSFLPLAGS